MDRQRPAKIIIYAEHQAAVADMCQLFDQAGHAVHFHATHAAEPAQLLAHDLVVLDSSDYQDALRFCGRVRARLSDDFVPVLLISGGGQAGNRLAGLEAGADIVLQRPFTAAELLAQIQALLRLKLIHDRAAERTAEFHRVNKQLEQAYQQINQEIELARRIQLSLLPQTLPEMPAARFAVHYRPCGRVGGDFYDVFRLDEDHVGFYVADVMGHGVPASLLTIFLKKAVRAKEIFGKQYRLLPPDEVLQQLNRDLVGQALAESPFFTMVYGLFDCRFRTLAFARAGHPYPLSLPGTGDPELWKVHGTLLGVFETQFSVQTRVLQPGDKVFFYTDGLDTSGDEAKLFGAERLRAHVLPHRALPIEECVAQTVLHLFDQTGQPDDFTLLGLEVTA